MDARGSERSGYKVIFVSFAESMLSGAPLDVVTKFLKAKGRALGRPVGVAMHSEGAILIAADVGNSVWRVTASAN